MDFSIIKKSKLEGARRLDAEYYQPEYLDVAEKLKSIPHETVDGVAKSIVSFGAYALTSLIEWQESGIPFIVAANVKDGYLDLDDVRFISKQVDEVLQKSRVQEGQVLLSMSGSVGNAAVAHQIPLKLNSNQDIVKITPKVRFSPYFIAAFFNSKYGRTQILRLPVGSVQQHIFLWQIKTLLVPKFSQKETDSVVSLYKDGLREIENSKSLYSQAEQMVLEELGLRDFESEDELYNVVKLSDVREAERMDAQHFQSKYEKLERLLCKKNPQQVKDITSLVGHATQSEYVENGPVAVMAQKHMQRDLSVAVDDFDNFTDEQHIKATDKQFILQDGDLLVSTAGEPGLTTVWNGEYKDKVIPGSFITVMRANKEINPYYFGVFLNSIAGKSQFEKYSTASIQQYVYPKNIKKMIIPVLPKPIQQKIADLVRQSHEARKKAKDLLEEAKATVERLIEEGEK